MDKIRNRKNPVDGQDQKQESPVDGQDQKQESPVNGQDQNQEKSNGWTRPETGKSS